MIKNLMHKKLYKFFTGYGYAVLFIIIAMSLTAHNMFKDTNTSGIIVSTNKSELICDNNIKILNITSIDHFFRDFHKIESISLSSQICSFDKAFQNTPLDRAHLFKFSEKVLNLWTINRPDIVNHFHRKLINSEPDDALSKYIKNYKQ